MGKADRDRRVRLVGGGLVLIAAFARGSGEQAGTADDRGSPAADDARRDRRGAFA
jgi:hypothetical protein